MMEQGHILIADDNADNHAQLVKRLEANHYQVTSVYDGQAVLDAVLGSPTAYDLILLGLGLPKVSGYDVLRRIKSDDAFPDLPVILISSISDVDEIARCIEGGAEDYLVEPFEPSLLDARIKVTLEKLHLQRQQRERANRIQHMGEALRTSVLPIAMALLTETDFDRLLERILDEAKHICNADAATLYLRTASNKLKFAIVETTSLGIDLGGTSENEPTLPALPLYKADGSPNHQNVATHVALSGHSHNIEDIYSETDQFDFSATQDFDQRMGYRSTSSLTVPVKNDADDVIAVLQLLNALDPETGRVVTFDPYQQLVVEALAAQVAVALKSQQNMREQAQWLKIEHDVEVAHNIQNNFLPKSDELPQAKGYQIDARLTPARQVAGDFYDVFEMTHDRIGFLVADVCDKGVPAALFMALMRSLTRAFAQQHYSLNLMDVLDDKAGGVTSAKRARGRALPSVGSLALEKAVTLTNEYVAQNHASLFMFATMFIGVLDPSSGTILYINGGHNPPMIAGADGTIKERLQPSGPAVGMMGGANFEISETKLEPGDVLLAFSDGVPEARAPNKKFFGDDTLEKFLTDRLPVASAASLLDDLEVTLRDFIAEADQFDDITMMAVHRLPASEEKDSGKSMLDKLL